MGLFGLAEIMSNLDRVRDGRAVTPRIGSLWPTREEVRRAVPASLRGTALGAFLGILPGGGAVLASFAAYTLEKKISRTPGRIRQRRGRRRGRRRNPPTMPARRPRSFRC